MHDKKEAHEKRKILNNYVPCPIYRVNLLRTRSKLRSRDNPLMAIYWHGVAVYFTYQLLVESGSRWGSWAVLTPRKFQVVGDLVQPKPKSTITEGPLSQLVYFRPPVAVSVR